MSELVVYKPDFKGKVQEFECDLIFDADIPEDVFYEGTAGKIQDMQRSLWHIGAALEYGQDRFGESCFDTLHEMTGFAINTLKQIRRVYHAMVGIAVPGLSFWSHKEAMSLPEPMRVEFLGRAQDECWTWETVRDKAREIRETQKGGPPPETCNKPANGVIEAEFSEIDEVVEISLEDARRFSEFIRGLIPDMDEAEKATATEILEAFSHARTHARAPAQARTRVAVNKKELDISPNGKEKRKGSVEGKEKGKPKKTAFAKVKDVATEHICDFESLDNPEFRKAWADWNQHRREIKKPLTEKSAAMQLRTLSESRDPVKMIEYTIFKGWQGLKEPENGNGKGRTIESIAEKAFREAGCYATN